MVLQQFRLTGQWLYRHLLQPRSNHPDSRRREFILNVLLSGLTIITFTALVATLLNLIHGEVVNGLISIAITAVFLLIIISFLHLSRRGWHNAISYILLVCTGLLAINLLLQWSFELPMAEMAVALTLVLAGVLLTARSALILTAVTAAILLIIGFTQSHSLLHPDVHWLKQPLVFSDAVGYVAIFIIIGLVSWLANREIDQSLARARRSEAALQKERDSLEHKVAARTRQLEETQLARVLELQRFAEFGRLSAGLVHEVSNPLMAASLYLEQLSGEQPSKLVKEARKNLQHLEKYLQAVRQQLRGYGGLRVFSVTAEINQVINMLRARARKMAVEVTIQSAGGNGRLYGDPVKFSQLIANLIANGIDAYEDTTKKRRQVIITVETSNEATVIAVTDWGKGIEAEDLPHVLEPFYSTKLAANRGLGLGLAIVKQYVEEDFGGTISVSSSRIGGTTFVVNVPRREIKR